MFYHRQRRLHYVPKGLVLNERVSSFPCFFFFFINNRPQQPFQFLTPTTASTIGSTSDTKIIKRQKKILFFSLVGFGRW